MAKRLILVRHARIAAGYRRLIGATDVPLDAAGEAQAQAMARRVMDSSPCAGYCSPMLRCRQTAAAMAPELPLTIDADLREIDFGQWENHTFTEAAVDDPLLVDRWAVFDPSFAFPNGENLGGFFKRVPIRPPTAWRKPIHRSPWWSHTAESSAR